MNSDGSGQTNVTDSPRPDFGADWSPDGSQLVFTSELPGIIITSQFDIMIMNGDGSGLTNVTNSDFVELEPAWSPLGSRVAYAAVRIQDPEQGGDWEIVTANTDGSAEAILTQTSQEDRGPDWSPDGSKLVWMSAFDATLLWRLGDMGDERRWFREVKSDLESGRRCLPIVVAGRNPDHVPQQSGQ